MDNFMKGIGQPGCSVNKEEPRARELGSFYPSIILFCPGGKQNVTIALPLAETLCLQPQRPLSAI